MRTSKQSSKKGGFTPRTRPTKISTVHYRIKEVKSGDTLTLERGFAEAARRPEPTPGPGRRRNELKEFPLHKDPLFERRYMEERISGWVPDIASVLGTNPDGAAIVTPSKTLLASSDTGLLWLVVGDFLISEVYPYLPKFLIKWLAPRLNRISAELLERGHVFTVLKQVGN